MAIMQSTVTLPALRRRRCAEQGLPVVFSLTRKRLGQIYGCRKRVSAVALLDYQGAEELHGRMVALMNEGKAAWEEKCKEGGGPPQSTALEAESSSDEEEEEEGLVEEEE